ncbi:alpha/beta hydrolase family protein [Roseimaritima ulvae]|uniref:Acetyl xylan esterase (AXE1) n=1 Tax=Roseimaritima ulvae TaxID=980254 RepID=A0A5B9QI71_9BACT|nr:alpha/beta hydrolase family protein [Roseimaritima ulvae]QEG38827.1 Acetyl xylan esterase (AXE1) [Roseimaritima ulvae]
MNQLFLIRFWLPHLCLAFTAAVVFNGQAAGQDAAAGRGSKAFAATRVLGPDAVATDSRSEPLKDLNGHFPFAPPEDLEAWEARAAELRKRVLVATGLWPMPQRTPMNPVIHGKVQRDGFTIEKVYFESVPGHFVTGMLFRPEKVEGQLPGILCPHGHGGRMNPQDRNTVRRMIAAGQERFEESGSNAKLARCAQLARMGCVVFMFDMLGYADSQQISYDLAHRYGKPRSQYAGGKTSPDGKWGFFTVQAESRLQTIMGLQTWNAIRSLDFLEQLPDTDPKRLAVTGNSGGGTQTILLGAIDDRPIASFPNGMVSVSMQGGCTCENCSLLRIGTGNVELAALMAPKPQAMTAADDWTIAMMTDGYPQLQQTYDLYGKRDNVLCRDFTHFPHNFNYVTRGMMYSWFNKHIGLGLKEPIVEEDWPRLTDEESALWTDQHPAPPGGDAHEQSVTSFLDEQANQQIDALLNENTKSLQPYRELVGTAWNTIIGRTVPDTEQLERDIVDQTDRDGYRMVKQVVKLKSHDESLPVVSLIPTKANRNGKTVLWIDDRGKASLMNETGKLVDRAQQFIDAGTSIIAADLFGQGEFTEDGLPVAQQRVVKNPRQYAGYTFTYNPTLLVRRVHDVMTLLAQARTGEGKADELIVYGRGGAEPIAAAAVATSGANVKRLMLQSADFRFDAVPSYRDPYFVPGGVKYGDLPGLLALVAPTPIELESGDLPALAKWAQAMQ